MHGSCVDPGRLFVCFFVSVGCSACDGPRTDAVVIPVRETLVAPAARGAVGAYAQGGTPWTDRAPSAGDAAPLTPPPPLPVPQMPLSAEPDSDGGVAL